MIPFRTQRLATSVVNRILELRDSMPVAQPASGEPSAPEPSAEGAALEASLSAPKAPVDAAPDTAEQIALAPML